MKTQTQWLFEAPPNLETDYKVYPYSSREFEEKWEMDEQTPEFDSELESIFGSIFDKIEDVVDWGKAQFMVRKEILAGNQDENQLTSLVFFARYPERQGRKLNKSESNFQQLSQEWLEIRDRIVRPILNQTQATPASSSSNSKKCIQQGNCKACERRLQAANPTQLVDVPKGLASRQGIELDKQVLAAYQQLYQEARAAGIPEPYLKIFSGHRSYNQQVKLWKGRLLTKFKKLGCSEASLPCVGHAIDRTSQALQSLPIPYPKDAWVKRFLQELKQGGCVLSCDPRTAVKVLRHGTAPPGASPHHTGRAVDVFVGKAPGAKSSASTERSHVEWQRRQPSFQWLVCNAVRFGFYPYNAEPWHWEYNPPT
jgi:LAS superfamily LD-carboxypeptidase LdcB